MKWVPVFTIFCPIPRPIDPPCGVVTWDKAPINRDFKYDSTEIVSTGFWPSDDPVGVAGAMASYCTGFEYSCANSIGWVGGAIITGLTPLEYRVAAFFDRADPKTLSSLSGDATGLAGLM